MTESTSIEEPLKSESPEPWEWWTRVCVAAAILFVFAWILVFLKLGIVSVYAHAIAIPSLGFLTIPLAFFGLLRTIFRPPAIRRSRTIALLSLLAIGAFGTIPIFSPPMSTDDWQPSSDWRLPFEGEWMTMAGGKARPTNYHATTLAHRYGYDFTKVEDGKKFKMDGKKNEDFFCFGQPVLAPISGVIQDAENSQPDNTPGEVPPTASLGNYVILKVADDEFAFLAHLKKGSVKVAPGEQVTKGQPIGECGNSGRSVEPHLHFHAQNSPDFPYSESLPIVFAAYQADGVRVENAMPVGATDWFEPNGQLVRPILD